MITRSNLSISIPNKSLRTQEATSGSTCVDRASI